MKRKDLQPVRIKEMKKREKWTKEIIEAYARLRLIDDLYRSAGLTDEQYLKRNAKQIKDSFRYANGERGNFFRSKPDFANIIEWSNKILAYPSCLVMQN